MGDPSSKRRSPARRVLAAVRGFFALADAPGTNPLFDRTKRWTDRLADVMLLRLVLWLAIAAWLHQGVLTDAFKVAEWMDEHQFISWETSDRETLLRFGQLPAWNPYWCGGTVGIAAPEDPFLGPDFLLRLVFGVLNGRRLALLLLVVMGFEGTYRLCRRLDATVMAAAFGAVVYGACDRFVPFVHDGWINFLGFELVPWVLLCFLKGLESWRWRLLGGFFFAWIVLSAGTYTTPFTLLALAYLTFALSLRGLFATSAPGTGRRWLTPWVVSLTIGLVALGLAFGKLLPTLHFLRQFPRIFTPVEANSAATLLQTLVTRYDVVLLLALVGLLALDAAAALAVGGLLLFFVLAMGDFGAWSPFHLLKSLPIFSQLRFPDRYLVMVVLFAAVAAARGITRLEELLPAAVARAWHGARAWRRKAPRPVPPTLRWLATGLAAFAAYAALNGRLETVATSGRILKDTIYVEESARPMDQPFRQSRGNRRDAHVFAAANLGSINCFAGNPLPESPRLRADLPQEEYPADPAKATVTRRSWTPNEITLEVDAKEPTTIFVNQNWAPEWRASVGTVKNVEQLLAVDVPAGKNVVVVTFADRMLTICLLVSAVSFLLLLLVLVRELAAWLRAERVRWETLPTWPDELPNDEGDEHAK
ncbi:MAG: hypothetical protein JWP97_2750 [Labilithrix sp.]|nr:hypothetical protein [Labilithrix sp.]